MPTLRKNESKRNKPLNERKPERKKRIETTENTSSKKSYTKKTENSKKNFSNFSNSSSSKKTIKPQFGKPQFGNKKKTDEKYNISNKGKIRLNKYISNSGYCSRRDADTLIIAGSVTVDGKIITELGYKIPLNSVVRVDGHPLTIEKHIYLILNKPKDYITTVWDPEGRKTVMQLIKGACKERLYPVGRLDKNSTGLLIMTNDGEFARKIAHPSSNIIKLYEVVLDKHITQDILNEIAQGVQFDDGFVHVDNVAFVENAKSKNTVGIELHSGKYHVVKRIFEKFGFTVLKLDRTRIDILTKKNLPRGKWRFLTESEVQLLKRL